MQGCDSGQGKHVEWELIVRVEFSETYLLFLFGFLVQLALLSCFWSFSSRHRCVYSMSTRTRLPHPQQPPQLHLCCCDIRAVSTDSKMVLVLVHFLVHVLLNLSSKAGGMLWTIWYCIIYFSFLDICIVLKNSRFIPPGDRCSYSISISGFIWDKNCWINYLSKWSWRTIEWLLK